MKTIFEKELKGRKIKGNLSDDKLKLFLEIKNLKSEEGALERISFQELKSLVLEHVPDEERIHEEVIKDICAQLALDLEIDQRRVAKGIEPERGRDGKLVLMVKLYAPGAKKKKDKEEEGKEEDENAQAKEDSNDEGMDLRNLNLFDNITEGQEVARIYPPLPGRDGLDALGNNLPAESGKEIKVKTDKTLEIVPCDDPEKSYQSIKSISHGYCELQSGTLRINPELRIKDSIDYRVGNLKFIGSVYIAKDVMHGFLVQAQDGIHIHGTVDGGSLICEQGSIIIDGGVIGAPARSIVASEDVHLTRAQNAQVDCNGIITLKEESRDSVFRTRSAVRAPEATFFGGVMFAVEGVEIGELGNEGGNETIVMLCSDIETTSGYEELITRIDKHEKAIALLEVHLGSFALMPERIQLLHSEHRKKMEKLSEKLKKLRKSLALLQKKQDELLATKDETRALQLNVMKIMHPGVKVSAGDVEFKCREAIEGPFTLYLEPDDKEFRKLDLKPFPEQQEKKKKVDQDRQKEEHSAEESSEAKQEEGKENKSQEEQTVTEEEKEES